MNAVPCKPNRELKARVEEFAEALKTEAHTLGTHGLSEKEFYQSGLFRGAVERIRGQFAASMAAKRDFMKVVLNYLQDEDFIRDWKLSGNKNRFDYTVVMKTGKVVVIESKGGLDGNNTNIFRRPHNAQEFVVWSLTTNPAGDVGKNVWSGIHTRLSAEIIDRETQIDGLIVWDWICGTLGRPCPKLAASNRLTEVGPFALPPPCIYLFPATIPSPRNNPEPAPHKLEDVEFLAMLHKAFGGDDAEVHSVEIRTRMHGAELERLTQISRAGQVQRVSDWTAIRRA